MMKIIVVDGNNLFYKILFVYKLTKEEEYKKKMIYFFLENIVKFQEEMCAEEFVICFDDKQNFRKEINEHYKANRKGKDEENKIKVIETIEEFKNIFNECFNIFSFSKMEADDLAYAFSSLFYDKYEIILYSSDKDWSQILLLGNNIKQYATLTKKEIMYEEDLLLKKAVIGDSDNIKGVKGIGEKKFLKFKEKYLNSDESIKQYIEIIKNNIDLISLEKNPFLKEIQLYIKENFIENKFNKKIFFNKVKNYYPELYNIFSRTILY